MENKQAIAKKLRKVQASQKTQEKINKKKMRKKVKDFRKRQKTNNAEYVTKFKNCIVKNKNKVWCPSKNILLTPTNSDSWFSINKYQKTNNYDANIIQLKTKFPEDVRACFKVTMNLTKIQKTIMNKWLNAYIVMYNRTIAFIKQNYKTIKNILNFKNLRTYHMLEIREMIRRGSQLEELNYNTEVPAHVLDASIHLACANYQSALTNLKRGHIRHFRIRAWKFNKPIKILDIEVVYFNHNSISPLIFGQINCTRDGENFDLGDIPTKYPYTCKVFHDKTTETYTLLVPNKIKVIPNENPKQYISLDLGIRTFATGISENEVIEIGSDVQEKIKFHLEKLHAIHNNEAIPQHIKQKNEKRIHRKISAYVDELHWKTIKFLTTNYKNILIGDLSVKGITCNETSKLNRMTKEIGYRMKFYQFRQRLEYKCISKQIHYRMNKEMYTSKMCSYCGWMNDKLGSSKTFVCDECKKIMDRDVNGARNILTKIFMK